MDIEQIDNSNIIQNVGLIISLGSLAIAIAGLTVAILVYFRKKGHSIRGNYTITYGAGGGTPHPYVSRVSLENCKDAPISIRAIYAKLSRNIYLELKSFEALEVLSGYETRDFNFEAVDYYSSGLHRVNITKLLRQSHIKLIVSTNKGKVVAKGFIQEWSPLVEKVRNDSTWHIIPFRPQDNSQRLGGSHKYCLEITRDSGVIHYQYLNGHEYLYTKQIGSFRYTKSSLKSAGALQSFLDGQVKQNLLPKITSIKVHDVEQMHLKSYGWYSNDEITIGPISYLNHKLSFFQTWFSNHNRRRLAKAEYKKRGLHRK